MYICKYAKITIEIKLIKINLFSYWILLQKHKAKVENCVRVVKCG